MYHNIKSSSMEFLIMNFCTLQTLRKDDFKKKIILRTLCTEPNCRELLSILQPLLVRRLRKQTLIKAGEKDPDIYGMSYNSARDDLLLAEFNNILVRAMSWRDNAGDLRDVNRGPHDTTIHKECMLLERLGHAARVFW